MLRVLRKRPGASLGLLSGALVVGGAAAVEHQANEKERRFLLSGEQEGVPTPPLLPRAYEFDAIHTYWSLRPITTVSRMIQVASELTPIAFFYFTDFVLSTPNDPAAVQKQHAKRLRQALTRLGPAFVKGGQQLSIRPDLVPPAVLKELQKLCDSVEPIPDDVAWQVMEAELGVERMKDLQGLRLVAAASLGQVYKATLVDGSVVAVKVQRPNMKQTFSLDLYLLQRIGVMVDLFTSVFTNQPPFHRALYESFAGGSYQELDYANEAINQKRFQKELRERKSPVKVPDVYAEYSTEKVLTSEWIDGIKLADSPPETIRKLIPVGVELFLTQLLDIGGLSCRSSVRIRLWQCMWSLLQRAQQFILPVRETYSSPKPVNSPCWTLACAQRSIKRVAMP